jgi:peroxiredoxin
VDRRAGETVVLTREPLEEFSDVNHETHGRIRLTEGSRWSALAALVLLACVVALGTLWSSGCKDSSKQAGVEYQAKPMRGTKNPAERPSAAATVETTDEHSQETPAKKPRVVVYNPRKVPKEAVPVPAESTRDLHEPEVAMTEAHAKTCLVKVGDVFPELTLSDTGGSQTELSKLRGEKLTIVVFWNIKKTYAAEQFAQLQAEVSAVYSKFGVGVVAINVGDPPDTVAGLERKYENDFPCLLDPDGAAFKQVATDKLPRTYVLDAQGKILWFDLEYSQTTRYELKNAVYYYLK